MATEEEGWSSLPAELVNLVADRFLATNDLDYYMNLRAVCHGWRSATADPRSNQQHDPRFRPTRWLMLKEEEGHAAAEFSAAAAASSSSSSSHTLFFNVTNGRIVRMSRLPQLIRDYILISATTCGLLVLASRCCPHAVCVLNPFTGYWTSFKVRVPPGTLPLDCSASAAMVGSSPTLVLGLLAISGSVAWSDSFMVYWADRQSKSFSVETRKGCSLTMLPLIAAGKCAAATTAINSHRPSADGSATTVNIFNLHSTKNYLCDTVELADGTMLAVLTRLVPRDYATIVFTIDSAGNVMEQVKSIGSHTLLLGSSRCLAVKAEAFPAHTIEANYMYNLNFGANRCRVYKFGTRREHAEQAQWLAPSRLRLLPPPIRQLSGSMHQTPDYPQGCSGWRCYFEKGRATKLLKRAVAVIVVVVLIVVTIVKSGGGGGEYYYWPQQP